MNLTLTKVLSTSCLAIFMILKVIGQTQPSGYYMRVEVDTADISGDPTIAASLRAGGIRIPSNPIEIPLNQHQRATYRKDRNETYLSAVNMMNQVTLKFSGDKPGKFELPDHPASSPKVRVFLADINPILDGTLVSGKLVVTEYKPGEYIAGTFEGREKVAGYDLYFGVKGQFKMPSVVR